LRQCNECGRRSLIGREWWKGSDQNWYCPLCKWKAREEEERALEKQQKAAEDKEAGADEPLGAEAEGIISIIVAKFRRPQTSKRGEYLEAVKVLEGIDPEERESVIKRIILNMVKTFEKDKGFKACLGAVDVLKSIGPEVVPAIAGMLARSRSYERQASSRIVLSWASALYEREAATILIGLLGSKQEGVAVGAEACLLFLGSRKTKKAIEGFYDPLTGDSESPSESAVSSIIRSIEDNSVTALNRKELTDKLLWILEKLVDWQSDFLHEGFVVAREIGKQLYAVGGKEAMEDAFRTVVSKPRYREHLVAAESLEFAWKGIEGWEP
jgi:hypothetical protein